MVDTHAHLTEEVYDADREAMIASLSCDGLKYVFTVVYDVESSKKCVELAEKYENIYAIIGIHPENCKEYNASVREQLKQWCTHPKVIAIGEIGLDYHYEGYDKELQKEVLLDQIQLAYEMKMPIVIHLRDAVGDFIPFMQKHHNLLQYGVLLHCFSESLESYQIFEKMGFYVAFGGTVTFKNAPKVQKVAQYVPLDKLVLETDCPYLAPTPYRGQINYPKYVSLVAQKIAELKQCSLQVVLEQTDQNVKKIFPKVK